jgi:hypothetical protein
MGHCTDEFTVLNDGTAAHELLPLGTTIVAQNQ